MSISVTNQGDHHFKCISFSKTTVHTCIYHTPSCIYHHFTFNKNRFKKNANKTEETDFLIGR